MSQPRLQPQAPSEAAATAMAVDSAGAGPAAPSAGQHARSGRVALALGGSAVHAAAGAAVLVCGWRSAAGAEAAKCLVLSGVGRLVLALPAQPDEDADAAEEDITFLSREDDVAQGEVGAEAEAARLQALDASCKVELLRPPSAFSARQAVAAGQQEEAVAFAARFAAVVVCGRGVHLTCDARADACRAAGVPVLLAAARGAFALAFADFGASFDYERPSEAEPRMCILESATASIKTTGTGGGVTLTVSVADEGGHAFQNGDRVELISCVGGAAGALSGAGALDCTITGRATLLVHAPPESAAAAEAGEAASAYLSGSGYLRQVFGRRRGAHVGLREALASPRFCEASGDSVVDDAATVLSCFRELAGEAGALGAVAPGSRAEALSRVFAAGVSARFALAPVAAVAGAIAASEALKAVTGVHAPLQQLFTYHAADALFDTAAASGTLPAAASQQQHVAGSEVLTAQATVLGAATSSLLTRARLVVVGAGAVGCEVLKNLALMGAACNAEGGELTVVDGDEVEEINLCRQMLYDEAVVGIHKASAAASALAPLGPRAALRVTHAVDAMLAETSPAAEMRKVEATLSTEGAVLACCTDTGGSRMYADSLCLARRRAMVDFGTWGSMGSVTSVVPHESELWSASADPPERRASPPLCVLNNFPYLPAHACVWAREQFQVAFEERPRAANRYLQGRDAFVSEATKRGGADVAEQALRSVFDSLGPERPRSLEECASWAAALFEVLFGAPVHKLLAKFGPDSLATDGSPFWSGVKRCPRPVMLDPTDALHLRFVRAAANLRAHVYGLKGTASEQSVSVAVAATAASAVADDGEACPPMAVEGDTADARVAALLEALPTPGELAGFRLSPLSLARARGGARWHVDFLECCAALRARCYSIPAPTQIDALRDAAEVVPALPATTALVAALGTIELLKAVRKAPRVAHCDIFLNTALPLMAHAAPREVKRMSVATAHGPRAWSVWDTLEVALAAQEATLGALIAQFESKYGLEVCMVSYKSSLLFMDFMPAPKQKERKDMPLLELIATVGKVVLPKGTSPLYLSLSCTDAQDEDVELGAVRVMLSAGA